MSSTLPRPLAPWRESLALFPEELSLGLGPWLLRLDQALGPLRARAEGGSVDPDGLGGVARRGDYSRLLLSEWLLADEAPEEFVRRAAMREHLFLEVARRRPAGSARCVALFDAGPEQLGAPRIAHLAALLVLARRAAAAGAAFAWGVAQDERRALHTVVDAATVKLLLAARSALGVDEAAARAWSEIIAPDRGLDDLWLVGGASLGALGFAGAPSRLLVEDVLEPGARSLRVRVRRGRGAAGAPVELALPPPRASLRLLRDPFEVGAPPLPSRELPAVARGPLLFGAGGRRLLLRDAAGRAVALHIPDYPGAPPGRTRLLELPDGAALVALGWHHRRPAAVYQHGDELVFAAGGRPAPYLIHTPKQFAPVAPGADAPVSPLCFRMSGSGGNAWFTDVTGALFDLRLSNMTLKALPFRAAGLIEHAKQVLAVIEEDGTRGTIRQLAAMGATGPSPLPVDVRGGGELEAHWARLDGLGAVGVPVLAVPAPGGGYVMCWRGARFELHPGARARVLGVAALGDDPESREPGLILLEPDERTIIVAGRHEVRRLLVAPAPVTRSAAAPTHPALALVTEAGGAGGPASSLLVARTDTGKLLLEGRLAREGVA